MMTMQSLAVLDPGGCPCGEEPGYCACNAEERVLRCFVRGSMPCQMTQAQREECLREVARVEGYERKDYETASDADLARGVIHAWTDHCRDLGMNV